MLNSLGRVLAHDGVKATPTFNRSLCDKFGVLPLEFDGRTDSVFHAFDSAGRKHMEYIADRGHSADFPYEEMLRVFAEVYPHFYGPESGFVGLNGDFEAEAEAETASSG